MRKSALAGILPYAVALVVAVAPLLLGKLILRAHADSIGRTEVEAIAARYLARAERVLSDSIQVLRDLDGGGHHGCLDADRVAFAEAVSRADHVRRLGLVDENGYAMCLEPPPPARRGALLPHADEDGRQVAMVVTPIPKGSNAGANVVVGWRSLSGARLVAELADSALDIDPGPSFALDTRSVEVTLNDTSVWLKLGRTQAGDAGAVIVSRARSDILPVDVVVRAASSSFFSIVQALDMTLTIAAIAVGLVLAALTSLLTRRPEKQVDDEIFLALKNHEFVPYYQPVMNIESGQIEGCELLARWIKPDGTVVSPGRFMPYAETSGHVFEMTRQLMRQSVSDLGPLYQGKRDLKLSINLFAGHFDDRKVIDDIVAIYADGPIAYDQLVFEVTERYPLRDIEKARRIIAELHALGCRVALDDTGTGHGGLAYLQQLGIDIIKIDKMFIDAMGADLGASTIVDVLVELANSLGMGLVAEGVEREEQIDKLREKGVTAAQGYVFAPPLPAKLFLELAGALVVENNNDSRAKAA
ncbi:EAL domain-containing protein [Prosthecomicrobium sp. N25]|uniref:EAL domain-containing protein n=1 Tax=Prosthecomicrobium sp. N25 TaxID=3129254 RepID=UPI003076A558